MRTIHVSDGIKIEVSMADVQEFCDRGEIDVLAERLTEGMPSVRRVVEDALHTICIDMENEELEDECE